MSNLSAISTGGLGLVGLGGLIDSCNSGGGSGGIGGSGGHGGANSGEQPLQLHIDAQCAQLQMSDASLLQQIGDTDFGQFAEQVRTTTNRCTKQVCSNSSISLLALTGTEDDEHRH